MNVDTLRERLLYVRRKELKTIQQLADDIGISWQTLEYFFNKKRGMQFLSLAKIANYLEKYGEKNDKTND